MHGCRVHQKGLRIFVGPARVVVELLNVAGPYERKPVGNASAFNGRLIPMGLGNGPRGHKAAGAPAENGQAVRVGPSLAEGVVGRAVDIAIGTISEMLVDGVHEGGAITGRSAILRLDHDISHTCEYPGKWAESERVVGLRTTMREHHKWIFLPGLVVGGEGDDTL